MKCTTTMTSKLVSCFVAIIVSVTVNVFAEKKPAKPGFFGMTADYRDPAPWWSYRSGCPSWTSWPNTTDQETAIRRGFECREEKVAIARINGDNATEALLLEELAKGYFWRKENDRGIEVLNQALEIVRKVGEPCWESYLTRLKSAFLKNSQDRNEVLELAVDIAARGTGCEQEHAVALGDLGQNAKDEAVRLEYFEEALRLARVDADPGNMVRLLRAAARIYSKRGDRRAVDYRLEIIRIFRETGNRKYEMMNVWNLGVEYERLGEFETAIPYLQKYIDFCEEKGLRVNEEIAHLEWLSDSLESVRTGN